VLRRFLRECVILCVASRRLLCVGSLDRLAPACNVIMLPPRYFILLVFTTGADYVCIFSRLAVCRIDVSLCYSLLLSQIPILSVALTFCVSFPCLTIALLLSHTLCSSLKHARSLPIRLYVHRLSPGNGFQRHRFLILLTGRRLSHN
jgi:hypothetical protein